MVQIFPALIFILSAHLIGFLGALFTSASCKAWYVALAKPAFTPPAWVFGPVWGMLYTLMGFAAYLVWESRHEAYRHWALGFYALQLALNGFWTFLFFYHNCLYCAFFDVLALWFVLLCTVYFFWKVRPWAGIILLPYLAWVSFAMYLSHCIWQMN